MNYFDDTNSKHFSFETFAGGLDTETFGVVKFKAYEAISKTYDFEIMLVSSRKDIDFEDVLQSQAVFTIHRGANDDVYYNGIISEFDQLHEVNNFIFYRARLVPKLWWLTLTHHNQVFLKQSVPEFIDDALRDGGLETADINISGLTGYEEIDYICQYDESHFNFVSRWLERQGIYYYFNQESDGEELVLTDTKFSHYALKQGSDLFYNPASGLEGQHMGESIGVFTCRQKQLPTEIILKDFNYERPSLDITSRANVDLRGRGISYIYGEYFSTPEEGERLAGIRAEELLCQKREFFGESTVPYIMPGFTFNLHNHYRDDFNQEYLILEVTHEGNQSHLMSGGIAADAGASTNQAIYRNSFKAIPNDAQYRPQRSTEKPKISGTIHAQIDAEVDGDYAQIDEQGRYRVKLPFDINDEHMDGKGSAPIRMMQPYAGKQRGLQFPLVKGTEVLLTFIEGNPDRPVIAGAVSNPETQGPVNAENLSESVIQTGGNNKIRMEDKLGSERVMIESPAANSWIRVGATNDPIELKGASPLYVDIGGDFVDPKATSLDSTDSANPVVSAEFSASEIRDLMNNVVADIDTSIAGEYILKYEDSNNTNNTASRKVIVRDPATNLGNDLYGTETDGIRIRSSGDLWFEAKSRYGEYHTGVPPFGVPSTLASGVPLETEHLLANFGPANTTTGVTGNYNPKNLKQHKSKATYCSSGISPGSATDDSFANALAQAHVEVSSLDTINTQEGNIYDFGGYWNYNLGNSFAEEHISQTPTLNNKNWHSYPTFGVAGEYTEDAGSNSAGSGAITGAVTGGLPAAAFATYLGIQLNVAVAPHLWSGGGGVAVGLTIAATTVFVGAAATAITAGVGAAVGAGLGAIAPGGDTFQGNVGDVIAGPESGSIETWARRVGSSFDSSGVQHNEPKNDFDSDGNLKATMDTGTAWVTKQFGDSYTYARGNDIDIRVGNTEQHQHGNTHEFLYGGTHEETKFGGTGKLVNWEKGGGGEKQEANWHMVTGLLTSYEFKKDSWFSYEGNFVTVPTLQIATNMSSVRGVLDLSVGALDINVSASVGVKMDINLSAGLFVNMHGKLSGEAEVNFVTMEAGFKTLGFKAQKKAAMDAKINDLIMEENKIFLKSKKIELDSSGMSVKEKKLLVDAGFTIQGV